MTLIFNTRRDSWGLEGFQLGINEIAASLSVGKSCGSIFTRREYSTLFDVVQDNVQFARSCDILGESKEDIVNLLNLLVIGGLASVVVNSTEKPDLPYAFKPHIATFVSSCIDADCSSDVANRARR
ncbi:hypothetical protein PG994_012590 [Apiospora phragmitis]|uniref:Uncharacterized protein n=1 Tax=Apiospora phragmitis TaxID=2905665 RepID=A0ABR1TAX1_9PEZI